jgi:RNA polymerase primary sigma factor/RNA polymerase nonessential primary-like sigma factor
MTDHEDEETLLTPDEVVSLQRQIEAGVLARAARLEGTGPTGATETELLLVEQHGERARQRFIRANFRLVRMVSRQVALRSHLPEADLFQEGCVGLITAVTRFDYRRGFRFSTYALFWIRAFVCGSAARQMGALNIPTSRAEQLRSARGVEAELTQALGRTPSVSEVAAALGRDQEWTSTLLAHQPPASLDGLPPTERDRLTVPADAYAATADQTTIRDLLWRLDELARRVLELRFGFVGGEPLSYAATARALGISVNRVRRTETRALETLRGICPQQAWAHLSA